MYNVCCILRLTKGEVMLKFVKCKNCGEAIAIDIESKVLQCEHCGKRYKNPYYKPIELEQVEPEVVPITIESNATSWSINDVVSIDNSRVSDTNVIDIPNVSTTDVIVAPQASKNSVIDASPAVERKVNVPYSSSIKSEEPRMPVRVSKASSEGITPPVKNTPKAQSNAMVPVQNQGKEVSHSTAKNANADTFISGTNSEFNGSVGSLIKLNIGNFFIFLFTLGLGFPWIVRRKYTWLYEHQVIDGRKLEFTGEAKKLFGQCIKWLFLSIITFGIYIFVIPIKMNQWIAENTHIKGIQRDYNNDQSYFNATVLSLIVEFLIACFLITLTCSLCAPWIICRMKRWEFEHKYYDGYRLVFDGKGGNLFVQLIKWLFLSVITFGIYLFWIPIKMQKWVTEHTHFEE